MLLKQHTTDRGLMETKLQNHFTDSIFYEIELTAKYCKMLGNQIFEQYGTGLTPDEFGVLDTLICNPGICQRDLAKLILKDRANTGKLLDNLEKRGFIKRNLSIKNNRPVKIVELTESGVKKAVTVHELVKPNMLEVKKRIKNTDLEKIRELLKEFREILNETVETKI